MDLASDAYLVPARHAQTELREKGSRFIAEVFRVETVEEVLVQVDAVRRREHAATHHCTAFRVGIDGGTFRYDDDGEPSGTAGLPILRQIDRRSLTNTLVVVTRYFGGTKLGTGGLARAYAGAASEALDEAGATMRVVRALLRITFAYDDTSPAMQVINQFDARTEDAQYTEATILTVSVRRSACEAFVAALTNALAGRVQVEEQDAHQP